jgi:hypothetical protein
MKNKNMKNPQNLVTDYLIIGAGAMGLAFADTLLTENATATVVIVDKRAMPGGHWVDAYPFVTLHQPAAAYGVNSTKLGVGGADLSSHSELMFYFEKVMKKLLSSGRVTFLPLCAWDGLSNVGANNKADEEVEIRSVVDKNLSYKVSIKQRLVDATYMKVQVPASHPPKYSVSDSHTLVPPNGLIRQEKAWSRYTIIGAGKTGIDAILFLLDSGVSPERIEWIISNDMWLWNRSHVQIHNVVSELTTQIKVLKLAKSTDDIFETLEKTGSLFRLNENCLPTKWRCATVAPEEYEKLKRISNQVRLGRVGEIRDREIILTKGRLPVEKDTLFVDCSANGLEQHAAVPIFSDRRITLQSVFMCQQVFSAAIIGKLETMNLSDAKRNDMWKVVPHPERVEDYPESMVQTFENIINGNKYMPWWLMRCRLNIMSHMAFPAYLVGSLRALIAAKGARNALTKFIPD